MSKNCIITTVKSKIKGNATSYIEKENEIFIPISKKFTLNQTRAMAQDKVNKINKEYLSPKFGEVVSLNTSYTDGTGINIHPSQRLVDAYEVKEGNKTIQEVNTLSNRNIEYFNGEDALLVQDEDDRELKVQKELDKIVENINNIKFDENGQGLLFGNLQNLAKSNRIAVGEIKVENKKITGFNKKPNPYLRDYNTDLTEVQAKKLFEKTNKSTKDYEGLAVYFANMFVNEIIDKDVHLKMGYMRLAEYSQQKPKILITDTNKKINPFYQYNNTIIVGIYQLQQLLENGNYSDYQKFQNLIQSVAQEESIHLFAEYLLSKETVDNIYSEMSEKDIQKIKDIYENENLDKNGIVHEYVRMVVQQHVFNSTTEQEKVKLTNSVLDFISKMINEIQQFLSEIIGQNNTQKTIEDVINFTKGNFSEELDAKIKNKIFEQGVILEASLKREQTNNIEEKSNTYFSITPEVDFNLRATQILSSPKADEVFRKGDKNNWDISKILQELQVPKDQQDLIKSFNTRNREEIVLELLQNYSYTVEIKTAKVSENIQSIREIEPGLWNFRGEDFYSYSDAIDAKNEYNESRKETPTQHYSNLTVPGGTAYTENEISTPLITPSIKGHAQFATNNGIGWFRSDDKIEFLDKEDLIRKGIIKQVPCG